jgi:hypothetical protein
MLDDVSGEGTKTATVKDLLNGRRRTLLDGPKGEGLAVVRRMLQLELPEAAAPCDFIGVPNPFGLVEEVYAMPE